MRITYKTTFIIHTKELNMIPWFIWPGKKKQNEKKTFKQHGSWQEMDLFLFSFFRVWFSLTWIIEKNLRYTLKSFCYKDIYII